MKKLLFALAASMTSLAFATSSSAATVTIVASDSEAYVTGADLNGDPTDGFEGVEVGISGIVDSTENAPGFFPVGTTLNWSFIFDPSINEVVSGVFSVVGYLDGNIIAGALEFPVTPPTPVMTFVSDSHTATGFDASIIDGDLSIGVAFPTGDISGIGDLASAIAASPISVSTVLVFDTLEAVPLPAGGMLMLVGLGGLAGMRRFRRKAR